FLHHSSVNSWQWDLHSSGSGNTLHWQWELILPVGTLSWQWECLAFYSQQKEPKADEISQEDLQQMMMIVQVEEVYVEALQVKYPIIDWERFDRDDLVRLWDLVKERFSTTEPTDDKEKALWVKLKRLFEIDNDDILWKLQRVNHKFKRGLFEIKASKVSTAEYMHFYYWLKILLLMKIRENNLSH
nr:hypothetical protein [Tanacetum cinerariifolium]